MRFTNHLGQDIRRKSSDSVWPLTRSDGTTYAEAKGFVSNRRKNNGKAKRVRKAVA